MLIVDVTSLHVWYELIITPLGVICFIIIILIFVSDPSFSLHLLLFSYSDPTQVRYFLHIIITHLIISSVCFICFLIDIMFTVDTCRSMAHGIFYTCCILYTRAGVSVHWVFEPSSLHFHHPITLAYVTSHVLRPPWGHEIRCRLRQPLLGQVFEIWLPFRHCHVSSSRRRLSDG